MAIKVDSENFVTGVGYWRSSVFSARSILENIAEEFENDLNEEPNLYGLYGDDAEYKVTITVERV